MGSCQQILLATDARYVFTRLIGTTRAELVVVEARPIGRRGAGS